MKTNDTDKDEYYSVNCARMKEERKTENFQNLCRAIRLLLRRQYFFLQQFLGNQRTNGGSGEGRQQRRPLLTVAPGKRTFLFLQLVCTWYFLESIGIGIS